MITIVSLVCKSTCNWGERHLVPGCNQSLGVLIYIYIYTYVYYIILHYIILYYIILFICIQYNILWYTAHDSPKLFRNKKTWCGSPWISSDPGSVTHAECFLWVMIVYQEPKWGYPNKLKGPTNILYIYICLVGGLEDFIFSIQLGIIIPTDFHIFQRGRSTN